MSASIGEVYVDVLPRADRLWELVVAQSKAGAAQAGQQLGDPAGDGIRRKIADGVERGYREGTERAKRTVGQGATVKVDADTASADRKLRETERTRDALGRFTSIRVDADTAGAQNRLNGLGNAVSGAERRFSMLTSAGFALGPAIIPGAVAATGAVLGLGSAIASIGVGIGVGALAFSGVGDAVKALAGAQDDAAKTARSYGQQQSALASGADQVASAEAALANTTASAADARERAARQVADAVRDLGRAQQDLNEAREKEKRDQEDLALDVRGNALAQQRAALDLARAEADFKKKASAENKIAYEEAKLRTEELAVRGKRLAEQERTNVRTGVEGSKQVVAAKQRVADAEQSVQDANAAATAQQRQAAFQVAQAARAVEAAQRSMGAATVAAATTGGAAVDKLEEQMGRLSPAGRDFAEFVFSLRPELDQLRAAAQGGLLPGAEESIRNFLPYVGDLREFVGDASTEMGRLSVEASEALTSPFWRSFFGYMGTTAVQNMDLVYEATMNVATGFAGIIQGSDRLQRSTGQGILAMTRDFARWGATVRDNADFQRFVDYAVTRGPMVVDAIEAVARAGLSIVTAYAPIGDAVLPAITAFGNALNAVPTGVLTTLLGAYTSYRIVAGGAAIAQQALNSNLLTGVGRMAGFGTAATTAGTQVTGFRNGAAGLSGFLSGPWGLAITAATVGIGALLSANAQSRADFDSLRGAAANYGDILRDGVTPASLEQSRALLAQNAGLRGLVDATRQAGITTDQLVSGLNGDAGARDRIVASLDAQIQSEKLAADAARGGGDADTKASKAHRDRAEKLEQMRKAFIGVNAENAEAIDLANALAGAQASAANSIANANNALTAAAPSAAAFANGIAGVAATSADAGTKATVFGLIADKVGSSTLTAAEKSKLFGQILDQLGSSATTSGPVFDALSGTFHNIAASSLSAHDKVGLLNRAIDQLYGTAISQVEAEEKLIRTQTDLATQLDVSSAGFDLNRGKQAGNTAEVLRNRDSLQAALQAARDKYVQDLANGVAEDEARKAHERNTKAVLDSIPPTQRSTDAVKDLVAKYGAIPAKKSTEVTTPGLDKAIEDLVEAHAVQIGLKFGWDKSQIQSEVDYLKRMINGQAGQSAVRKADGGLIPGFSPTKTSDNIPAMLTAREFVHPVDSVDYYGIGVMEGIRTRTIPRELFVGGGHRHYATGGYVNPGPSWPTPIDATQVNRIVDKEDLWRQWQAQQDASAYASIGSPDFGAGPGFPPWPSAHPGRGGPSGDSGVWRSIVALIRSTGPLSGSFGNGYRPGDPLWHGAGHAVDWMGFNQDALAQFLAARRPLELIHRTNSRDYAYTRGVNKGSFNQQLMNEHRNHIHIAMAAGGLVPGHAPVAARLNVGTYDTGGILPPGLTLAYNGTGAPETIRTVEQEAGLRAGTTVTVPVTAAPGMSVTELAKAVAAELSWNLR